MISVLLEETVPTINMGNVMFWVQFMAQLIGLMLLIGTPVWRLVRRSQKILSETISTIQRITETNEKQSECIKTCQGRLDGLHGDLGLIKTALLTLLKNELDKQCSKALNNGEISVQTRRSIESLYAVYKELGGNHGMRSTVSLVREIPVNPK